MFCFKCGEPIPDDSKICPKCGADLEKPNQQAIIYASQKEDQNSEEGGLHTKNVKKFNGKLRILAVALVVVVAATVAIYIQKNNLNKELSKEWVDTEGTILKVLDFSDGEVEYRLETGYSLLNTTLFTYDYKVISGKKIKVQDNGDDWSTYTIEFNDDKTVMTISPSITSTDSSEKWYYID